MSVRPHGDFNAVEHDKAWKPLVPGFSGGKFGFTVTCRKCPASHRHDNGPMCSPTIGLRKIRQVGWEITGRRATCPDCLKPKEKPVKVATFSDLPVIMPEHWMPNPVVTPPGSVTGADGPQPGSPAAARAERDCILILTERFNEARGAYEKPHSDETVAKEVKLSPAAVAKLREKYYGPLKAPSEIAALAVKIDAMAEDFARQMKAAEVIAADQIAKLRAELAALVKRNGWQS